MKRLWAAALTAALGACNPQPGHAPNATAAPAATSSSADLSLTITGKGTGAQPVRITQQSGNRRLYQILTTSLNSHSAQNVTQARFAQPTVTFYAKDGTKLTARSPSASVRGKQVVLSGGVHATTSTGLTLTCDTLTYDQRSEQTLRPGQRAHRRNARRSAANAYRQPLHLRCRAHKYGDQLVQDSNSQIVLRQLVKRYGERTVVDGVSAEVHKGEVVGLLGPNGAGKTTTFYMVVGLIKPDGGSVVLHNAGTAIDLTSAPMYMRSRRGIGYLAQENSIFRKLTVGDNIRLIWEMHGLPKAQQEERLGPLLEEFGLQSFINARGDSLSGGERRRVEIARAIATEPAFLLLDEPFTGIDPIAVADIQAMIRQLRDRGLGVLITDHQVRETLAIVDRAYILNAGRIEVSGSAHDVLESPIARKFYLGEGFRL